MLITVRVFILMCAADSGFVTMHAATSQNQIRQSYRTIIYISISTRDVAYNRPTGTSVLKHNWGYLTHVRVEYIDTTQ